MRPQRNYQKQVEKVTGDICHMYSQSKALQCYRLYYEAKLRFKLVIHDILQRLNIETEENED